MAKHIADALKHTAERVPRTLLATNFGHRASRDPQGDHFRDGENAENGGNNVNAVPEEQEIEGVALCPGLGIEGDKGHHQAEQTNQQALDQRVTREHRNERNPKQREQKKLGRTEGEHDGPQQRHNSQQEQAANDTAHSGRAKGGTNGPP